MADFMKVFGWIIVIALLTWGRIWINQQNHKPAQLKPISLPTVTFNKKSNDFHALSFPSTSGLTLEQLKEKTNALKLGSPTTQPFVTTPPTKLFPNPAQLKQLPAGAAIGRANS